jgi:hypothetical protein
MDDKTENKWHLDKKVPISLIIMMVMQFTALVWFVGKLDARILALETGVSVQHERDERQDKASAESDSLIRANLQDINQKLDRLIERVKK